jgi:membrane protein
VILGVIGFISTVSISLLMYLLVYTVVPNTRVKFGPALTGAAVAAVVWEASKWGFTQYLKFSTGQARLYGSIALVPLFLLWVYVTWCIVLFGLNVAYYLQHGRFHTAAQPVDLAEPTIVDPAATLSLMGAMARRFESGKPAEAADLSADLRIPTTVARDMLAGLQRAGLVNRIQRSDDNGSDEPLYALARPPERIGAEEVLKVGDEMSRAAADPAADTVRQARTRAVQGRDLASLMGNGLGAAGAAVAVKGPSAG